MEFKLKEGWLDYFMSGLFFGVLAISLYLLQKFQEELNVNIDFWIIIDLIILVLIAVVSFVMGCRVKRKP